jgi:signal transduction histidine kinase
VTLSSRRFALFAARYLVPGPLERDARFSALLRELAHAGLRVAGAVALSGVAAYLAYRVVNGAAFVWVEDYFTRKDYVALWDKAVIAALSVGLILIGRWGPGLRVSRLAMAAFVFVAGWVVVLQNFDPDNFNLSAGWLTLLLVVAVGTVPYSPWQVLLVGLGLTAEYWYFSEVNPSAVGDRPQLLFILLAAAVNTIVAGALYASRYAQYRTLRRVAVLKDYASARSRALESALDRERAMLERERAMLDRERSMQEQLVQAEKLASLGRLTAGVAHELKNPLNFVTNFAGLSRDLVAELREALTADPARPAGEVAAESADLLDDLDVNTSKIAEHGRRADAIIRNMLAHSRATPGARRPTDLNRLLDEYVGLAYHGMRAAHSGFNVDIRRDYDPSLGTPEVVPEEMGRVFLNLLDNAFDAVRARAGAGEPGYTPRVTVTTRHLADGDAEVTVADNGTGMPEAIRARVFEPFYTTKPSGQGTGLGLSLAYDIVTAGHGGTIEAASADGEGTTFRLVLPPEPPEIAALPPEPAGAPARASAPGDGTAAPEGTAAAGAAAQA